MKNKPWYLQPRHTASTWLVFAIALPAATMMHPTGASLLAVGLVLLLAFILRGVAHYEGYADGYARGQTERKEE